MEQASRSRMSQGHGLPGLWFNCTIDGAHCCLLLTFLCLLLLLLRGASKAKKIPVFRLRCWLRWPWLMAFASEALRRPRAYAGVRLLPIAWTSRSPLSALENTIELEGTYRVRTHAELLYSNPNLNLNHRPFNPQTTSLLGYPKVVSYTKFEQFEIILDHFWVKPRSHRARRATFGLLAKLQVMYAYSSSCQLRHCQ